MHPFGPGPYFRTRATQSRRLDDHLLGTRRQVARSLAISTGRAGGVTHPIYFCAFFHFAQRAFIASEIRLRAAADMMGRLSSWWSAPAFSSVASTLQSLDRSVKTAALLFELLDDFVNVHAEMLTLADAASTRFDKLPYRSGIFSAPAHVSRRTGARIPGNGRSGLGTVESFAREA